MKILGRSKKPDEGFIQENGNCPTEVEAFMLTFRELPRPYKPL
jgi:hypothetical protein